RHLLEERVLAREVVIHGLLGDAGAARDLVDARLVAVAHERLGGRPPHAGAVSCWHPPPPQPPDQTLPPSAKRPYAGSNGWRRTMVSSRSAPVEIRSIGTPARRSILCR